MILRKMRRNKMKTIMKRKVRVKGLTRKGIRRKRQRSWIDKQRIAPPTSLRT